MMDSTLQSELTSVILERSLLGRSMAVVVQATLCLRSMFRKRVLYPFRVLWFEGGGGANVEIFSVVPGAGKT